MNTFLAWLVNSSEDPTQWSLTVSSAGKAIVSSVSLLAALHFADPTVVTNPLQNMVDQAVILTTAGLTAFHAVYAFIGFGRKLINTITGVSVKTN